jgi:hypothetical protein
VIRYAIHNLQFHDGAAVVVAENFVFFAGKICGRVNNYFLVALLLYAANHRAFFILEISCNLQRDKKFNPFDLFLRGGKLEQSLHFNGLGFLTFDKA